MKKGLHIADWRVVPVEKTKRASDVVMQGVKIKNGASILTAVKKKD